jgi:hypothetical protein
LPRESRGALTSGRIRRVLSSLIFATLLDIFYFSNAGRQES